MIKTIAFTLIFFSLTSIAFAQTGTIKGQIYDRLEKHGLSSAVIFLTDTKMSTISDEEGNFQIDSIPFGSYNLRASYIGYGDTTLTNITISSYTAYIIRLELPSPCKYEAHAKNKICPICGKKDEVVPILYGLPIGPLDEKKYYYAGCEIMPCHPNWYCKRDKCEF